MIFRIHLINYKITSSRSGRNLVVVLKTATAAALEASFKC